MKEREKWINVSKCMAILAVMANHTYNMLYTNIKWAYCSFYSVSLFVLIMGITWYWSYKHSIDKLKNKVMRRIRTIMIPYGIAVIIYHVTLYESFDFITVLNSFIHFNISGPHYYVFLYLQLLLVSPMIYRFVAWTNGGGNKRIVLQLIGGIGIVGIATWTTNNSNILDIPLGGGKLLGGTYLILLYIGMLTADWYDKINLTSRILNGICIIIFGGLVFLTGRFIYVDCFNLDTKFPFGPGTNPPGISLMIYSLAIMFLIFYIVKFMEQFPFKFVNGVISIFDYIGRHTLYIFLYHMYFLDYYLTKADFGSNKVISAVIYFTVMIGGSILFEHIIGLACAFINKSYND
ncbi:MAG: acyltransferase [Butyrivibrio sp.]|nr:acyltransferase [Butyrivibrio sp.]